VEGAWSSFSAKFSQLAPRGDPVAIYMYSMFTSSWNYLEMIIFFLADIVTGAPAPSLLPSRQLI
jgi:hypothetical protein